MKERGALFYHEDYAHSYPHCERSDTPLIYKITSSYFVAVTKVKDRMIELAKKTTWSNPETKNRFLKWLEDARDWCVSRNRYFGTPLPIWESEDETESIVIPKQITHFSTGDKLTILNNDGQEHSDHGNNILLPIGKGAMGVVVRAEVESPNGETQHVAVKICLAPLYQQILAGILVAIVSAVIPILIRRYLRKRKK